MKEIWKKIKDYPYEISNLGRVRSPKRIVDNMRDKGRFFYNKAEVILVQYKMPKGYMTVTLYKDKKWKTKLVHRLVMETFSPIKSKMQVNHKNLIKSDNRLENLEWCTQKENMQHAVKHGRTTTKACKDRYKLYPAKKGADHHSSKLTEDSVLKIKKLLKLKKISQPKIAKLFNVSRGCISGIAYGENWKHVKL